MGWLENGNEFPADWDFANTQKPALGRTFPWISMAQNVIYSDVEIYILLLLLTTILHLLPCCCCFFFKENP